MVTQEMYDKGIRCRGVCSICKDAINCVQYQKDCSPIHNNSIRIDNSMIDGSISIPPTQITFDLDSYDVNIETRNGQLIITWKNKWK